MYVQVCKGKSVICTMKTMNDAPQYNLSHYGQVGIPTTLFELLNLRAQLWERVGSDLIMSKIKN